MDRFGNTSNAYATTEFEWPKPDDFKTFPKGQTIKLVAIEFKDFNIYGGSISALQLIFSAGLKSPLFLSKDETADNLRRVDLNFVSPFKTI